MLNINSPKSTEKIYIQLFNGQFADDWVFAAFLGANKLGYKIIFFEDIDEVPKRQFVVANIDSTICYFERTGIKIPLPLNIPNELNIYTKRKIGLTVLGDIITSPEKYNFPLFIKPADKLKAFTAGVLAKGTTTNLRLMFSDVENKNQLALISEIINMESEYRCFIHKNKLVGIKHYLGSFEEFPDIYLIKKMITAYTDSPISYTLDVAITDKVDTVLIECNDAWAIGNYGLDGDIYIRLLKDRWEELTNQK